MYWAKAVKDFDLVFGSSYEVSPRSLQAVQPLQRKIPQCVWYPPLVGSIKWNTDGSSLGKPGNSGIGGVLRDHLGFIICLFSCFAGVMDSNKAELLAVDKALEISISYIASSNHKVIFEIDSSNCVKWLSGCSSTRPWRFGNIFNRIENRLLQIDNFSFVFKSREHNFFADTLAKQGVSRKQNFIAWL